MRGALLVLSLPLLAAATGCTSTVVGDASDADTASSTAAVVVVERTISASEAPRGEAVARFLRVRGVPWEDALRVAGASIDLPPTGSCVSISTLGTAKQSPSSSVQLLDIGAVAMTANGLQTQLTTRRVPDVVNLVSGVVYARSVEPEVLPPAARYEIRVSGSSDPELSQLMLGGAAPPELADVRVGGEDASAASVVFSTAAVNLGWEPGAPADLVYVDVRAQGATVRCAFPDNGEAQIPPEAFAVGDEGTLGIHRLHREAIHAAGIDSGEMRFDFARTVAYSRR